VAISRKCSCRTFLIGLAVLSACTRSFRPEPVAGPEPLRIGTWNIQIFSSKIPREITNPDGGKRVELRNLESARHLGEYIATFSPDLLALQEIDADYETGQAPRSSLLDQVVSVLGASWEYLLADTGGSFRLAFLYDRSRLDLLAHWEPEIPPEKVDGADILPRDPLIAVFRENQSGYPFSVMNIHL